MRYLVDLDGTLLDHTRANGDAVEFIGELETRGDDFRIMTNSIKSPELVVERLKSVGIDVPSSVILNPINAINSWLSENGLKAAYIVGSPFEIDQVCAAHSTENPDVILLLDFEKNDMSYSGLQEVFLLMQKGVPVLAASGSAFYSKDGVKRLDTGAFISLLEKASGSKVRIMGKPSAEFFSAALSSLGANAEDVMIIGDDWSTDILGANSAGCASALLRAGKYVQGDEVKCKPDRVIDTLMDVFRNCT